MNIDYNNDIYKYWIGSIQYLKYNKIKALIDYFGGLEEAYSSSYRAMEDMAKDYAKDGIIFTECDLEKISAAKNIDNIKKKLEYLTNHGIKFITMLDSLYPDKLRHIYDPPFLLYYKGNYFPENKKVLSIVGARECSVYGRETAKYLACEVAREDIIILSGLARGIDSYAHMGALHADGTTYGIMGCGIDICYPAENISLYMDIQIKGGIISEYGPGIKPLAHHFPMRNRIISALSDGILVIEAREKSGSLITVDMGLDQGKNIYAVPGRITDKLSGGCNNLIKMGAKVVTTAQDILEDFIDYMPSESGQRVFTNIFNDDEKAIYELISVSPKHLDELIETTGLEMGKLMEHLLSLELKNLISQPVKNYYMKKG